MKDKAKFKGKKIELYDIDDNIEEIEQEEKRNKKLNILISVLIIIAVAVIAAVGYLLFASQKATLTEPEIKPAEIAVENDITAVDITYSLDDTTLTINVSSTESKSFTILIYKVLEDNTMDRVDAWSVLLSKKEGFKRTFEKIVENNTKYIIKLK